MSRKYNREPSEAQSNAEALARRGSSYSEASGQSFSVAWNWHNREPKDLRDAVRIVRQAYADEVPMRLHEGYSSIGEGGTPKMDVRAEGYLFGRDDAGESRPDPDGTRPALDYYRTPFRAALAVLNRHSAPRADLIAKVTISSMGPMEAAIRLGVPAWCAKQVAEDTLRAFIRNLSDVKVDLARRDAA